MSYINSFLQHPLILVFVFLNLAVGWWAHRKAKAGSFEDYAIASRSLPAGVLVMTILATMISDRELAQLDTMLEFGIIVFTLIVVHFVISVFFIGFCIAPRLVFYQEFTFGGLMKRFYGKGAQLLAGFIHCLFSLSLLVTQIASIGLISEKLLGINFAVGVIFFGAVAVLYSTLGGMRSVSYTDLLQLIMILFVLFWVTKKVIWHSGSVAVLVKKVAIQDREKLSFFDRPDFWERIKGHLGYSLLSGYIVMSPPLVHRMLIVKDKSRVSRTWYITALVYGIIIAMLLTIGLFGITEKETLGLVKQKNVFIHLVKYLFSNRPLIIECIALSIIGVLLSTIDSVLHTLGIIVLQDIIVPVKSFFTTKKITETMQLNFAKIGILLIGVVAVCIGSQVAHVSARMMRRALVRPIVPLQVVVTMPFILGVLGLKTDKKSFLTFFVVYLSLFYGQKWLIPWNTGLRGHRADYDYFLIALPLALLAYLTTHIYVNRGIAMVKRGKNYASYTTWTPSWKNIKETLTGWVKATFDLPELARKEVSKRPSHPLTFSIFMFGLYALGSSSSVSDESSIGFVMLIYLIGTSLCAGLMSEGVWPINLKSYFPLYWVVTLFFCLPFSGTLIFVAVHEGLFHLFFFWFSFVLLAFLVSSRAFVWMTILGIVLSWGGWYMMGSRFSENLWNEAHVVGYIGLALLILFVLFFGHYFENHMSQQLYLKNVFGHAVTHEASQPLNEVSLLSGVQANAVTALKPIKNEAGERGFFVPEENVEAIRDGSEAITKALQEVKRDFMHFKTLMSREIGQAPREKVYMKSLIDYVVLTLPKRYTSKVKVRVVCKEDFQAILIRPFFTNVIVNFLTNAFKHGLATEMVIEIDGSKRTVRIQDNGKGIPDDVLPHIFKFRFTTGDEKSNGVGLAFVKLILDASGVKIETNSKRGKGSFTEFVLTFS